MILVVIVCDSCCYGSYCHDCYFYHYWFYNHHHISLTSNTTLLTGDYNQTAVNATLIIRKTMLTVWLECRASMVLQRPIIQIRSCILLFKSSSLMDDRNSFMAGETYQELGKGFHPRDIVLLVTSHGSRDTFSPNDRQWWYQKSPLKAWSEATSISTRVF